MARRNRPLLLVASLLLVEALGCSEQGYSVVVRFDPPELARSVARVEVALVEGCAGQGAEEEQLLGVIRQLEVRRGEQPLGLGLVSEGTFGLVARGFDADCRLMALGCRSLQLEGGGQGQLVVVASAVAGFGCPPGTSCSEGQCLDSADADVAPDADEDLARDADPDGDREVDADPDPDGEVELDGDVEGDVDRDLDADPDGDPPCDCLIGGRCHGTGEINPASPCEACLPATSVERWTTLGEGSPCLKDGDDGICRVNIFGATVCCALCWTLADICTPIQLNISCGIGGGACVNCAESARTCDTATGTCE